MAPPLMEVAAIYSLLLIYRPRKDERHMATYLEGLRYPSVMPCRCRPEAASESEERRSHSSSNCDTVLVSVPALPSRSTPRSPTSRISHVRLNPASVKTSETNIKLLSTVIYTEPTNHFKHHFPDLSSLINGPQRSSKGLLKWCFYRLEAQSTLVFFFFFSYACHEP